MARQDKTSREKILIIFEDAKQWFGDAGFHGCLAVWLSGCLAVNAMGEFSGKDRAIEDSCTRFKRWKLDVLCALTKALSSLTVGDHVFY